MTPKRTEEGETLGVVKHRGVYQRTEPISSRGKQGEKEKEKKKELMKRK
jgi:hypothetical protein